MKTLATISALYPTVNEATIHEAMFQVVSQIADSISTGPDNDIVAATRQPVSVGAVFADLCAELGIAPPRFGRCAIS